MKLPGIGYEKPVQSMGRLDVSGFANASMQKVRAIRAATGLASDTLLQVAADMRERQTRDSIETANLAVAENDSEFERQHGGRLTYSADELPDEIDVPRTRTQFDPKGVGQEVEVTRTDIPAWEVRADLYKARMEKVIETQARKIAYEPARAKWLADSKIMLEKQYGNMVAQSAEMQKRDIKIRSQARLDIARAKGQWDQARYILDNQEWLTPEERKYQNYKIDFGQETSGLDAVLLERNKKYMVDAAANLRSEEYKGVLSNDQRRTYAKAFDREIKAIDDKKLAEEKEALYKIKMEVDSATQFLYSGEKMDPKHTAKLLEQSKKLKNPLATWRLSTAIGFSDKLATINSAPNDVAWKLYDGWLASAKDDPVTGNAILKLRSHIAANQRWKAEDTPDFAARQGIIDPVEIQFNKKEGKKALEGFEDSIDAILSNHMQTVAQLGSSSGPLSRTNLSKFVSVYGSAEPEQQLGMMNVLIKKGEAALPLMNQLRSAGLSSSSYRIGSLLDRQRPDIATDLLAGEKLLNSESGKLIVEGKEHKIKSQLYDEAKEFFQYDTPMMDQYLNDGLALYVKRMEDSNAFKGADMIPNSTILKQVRKDLLGPIFKFEGATIDSPDGKMGRSEYKKWMKNLHPRAIDGMGTPLGWDSGSLMKAVKSGRALMVPQGGGQYLLKDPNTGGESYVLDAKTGRAFVFKYDANAWTYADEQTVTNMEHPDQFGPTLRDRLFPKTDDEQRYGPSWIDRVLTGWGVGETDDFGPSALDTVFPEDPERYGPSVQDRILNRR